MKDNREVQAVELRKVVAIAIREGILPENQSNTVSVQTRDENGEIEVVRGVVGSLNLQAVA